MEIFDADVKSKLKQAAPYLRKIYTSLFASLTTTLFSFIILASYAAACTEAEVEFKAYAAQTFLVILFPVLVIGTAWLVFNYFDNLDLFNKRDYLEAYEKGKISKPLISSKPYLIGFAIEMLFSTAVFRIGYNTLLFFFFPNFSSVISGVLSVATMAILRLIQLWSLQNKWDMEIEHPLFVEKAVFKRNRDPYTFKFRQMIWQPIGFVLLFAFAASFLASYGFIIFLSVFYIIISPELWWTIFSIPIIIIIITYVGRALHGIRKRRILIKKLKQMENEGFAKVEYTGKKYLSSFFTVFPLSVKVTACNGEVYNCIVLTSGKINAPLYFTEDEYFVEHGLHFRAGALMSKGGRFARVVDISSWGGNENPTNMILGFRMKHNIVFPDIEGKTVILLNPVSTTAFSLQGRQTKPIDTGEDMKKYTIYTATGFFNHIERQSRKGKMDYDY